MPVFTYTAVDSKGQRTSGTVPAPDRAAALDAVVQQGLTPALVEEQPTAGNGEPGTGNRKHPSLFPVPRSLFPAFRACVSQADVEAFSRELASLLTAGVPLSRALQILGREASHTAAKKQWAAIHDDVVGGTPLADAMGKFPQSFPAVHVAMVRAGETGGFLDVVLGQIADFRSQERDLKSKIKGALVYPTVLVVLATCVLTFLLVYFIPRFRLVFQEFGATLPVLTQAIVAASNVASKYGLLVVIAAVLMVVVARRALGSEAGRRFLERTLLRVPALGRVLARFSLVRFCRMLGTLLGAGVPLVTALRVAREAIGNQTLSDAVNLSIEEVRQGKPLARSLASCEQLFPGTVIEMIAVAEETSRLDQELLRLATVYEADLDRQLRILVALAEPVLLFIMAAVVGTVVIGMLLPVFTLQEYIR
jgi:type II secretory pathway component PulF